MTPDDPRSPDAARHTAREGGPAWLRGSSSAAILTRLLLITCAWLAAVAGSTLCLFALWLLSGDWGDNLHQPLSEQVLLVLIALAGPSAAGLLTYWLQRGPRPDAVDDPPAT